MLRSSNQESQSMSVKCSGVKKMLTLEEGKVAWGSPGEVPSQVEAYCPMTQTAQSAVSCPISD